MGIVSYAQNFEDVILWRALGHIEKGFYVDIGAQDPVVDSVSLAFYEHGWRGVHVEPTQQYSRKLMKDRPDETVLQVAIGNQAGELTFYEFEDTGLSTANIDIARKHQNAGFRFCETRVPVIALNTLLKRIDVKDVHWLKLDVEGLERAVLESWKGATILPWVLVVESTQPMTQAQTHGEWEYLLLDKGYEYVYFDGLNRFYVSPEHTDLAKSFVSPVNIFDDFQLSGTASQPFYKLIETKAQQAEAKARRAEALTQQAEMLVHAMLSSTSWRVTKPLRWVSGGLKSFVKNGLQRAFPILRQSPWLFSVIKRFLSRFPTLERIIRSGVSVGMVDEYGYKEDDLTGGELKALMDLKDAIAVTRKKIQ